MLITDQMPDLNRYRSAAEKVQALGEYIYAFRMHLNHVLSNLDEDNLSEGLRDVIVGMENAAASVQTQLSGKAANIAAWPVGAVYLTADEEQDPAKAIGGRWSKLEAFPVEGVNAWMRLE